MFLDRRKFSIWFILLSHYVRLAYHCPYFQRIITAVAEGYYTISRHRRQKKRIRVQKAIFSNKPEEEEEEAKPFAPSD